MKIFCKLFGHRYNYYIFPTPGKAHQHIRSCKHCEQIQRYAWLMHDHRNWVTLVEYTKLGAIGLFKSLNIEA